MSKRDRIFLGHASEDKPRVRELYHQLKGEGFSPWLDAEDLIPGQNWRVEIPKAIKSAAIFLACLSKHSIGKRSYVQREFRHALSVYADLPPDSIYLIPVRLDECEVPDLQLPELELNLRDLQWVDLFEASGFDRLLAAIRLNVAPETDRKGSADVTSKPPRQDIQVFKSADASWCPEMVVVPAGTFLMGSPEDEAGRAEDEGPQHEVFISKPFALGRYAVTFKEFDHFCDATGRERPDDLGCGRGRHPVINVSYHDAAAYCTWLSEATGTRYHLPTEAMWEYACRAGTVTSFSFGANITTDQVNYNGHYPYSGGVKGQYRKQTLPVGSLPANVWGLHEMHGNVWEWCADWYAGYPTDAVTDPEGAANGNRRAVRGGAWDCSARRVRSAFRSQVGPNSRVIHIGFRCAGIQVS